MQSCVGPLVSLCPYALPECLGKTLVLSAAVGRHQSSLPPPRLHPYMTTVSEAAHGCFPHVSHQSPTSSDMLAYSKG